MLVEGFTLAVVTATGFYFIYAKLPATMKKWIHRHPLFTDVSACLATYILFGGTLTALFASAWLGIMISAILALTGNPTTNLLLEQLKKRAEDMKDKFVQFCAEKAKNYVDQSAPTKTITE